MTQGLSGHPAASPGRETQDAARRPSLHTRVAAWLLLLLAVTLAAFAAVLYLAVSHGLWREFEARLAHEVDSTRSVLAPYWTQDGISEPAYINPIPAHDRRWVEVWSLTGARLFQSPQAVARPIDGVGPATAARAVSTHDASGDPIRVLDVPTGIIGMPVIMRVVESESSLRAQLRSIRVLIVAGLLTCLLVAVLGSYGLTRYALRPLGDLVAQTADITADRLHNGVRIEGADREVFAVAEAFTRTLRRLDVSFEQAKRFSADASHELRTPITSIRTIGQVALQDATAVSGQREAIASMVEETEHLTRLLDALLLLARADAQQAPITLAPVDLGALTRDIADEWAVVSEDRQHTLLVDAPTLTIDGDASLLRLAIGNILGNAIRYTPPGGRIQVKVYTSGNGQPATGNRSVQAGTGQRAPGTGTARQPSTDIAASRHSAFPMARVSVQDSGPGIAPEHQALVFERFYRVDRGRSREAGGTGLGLSIAAWAATAHGGQVTVESTPGEGSTFMIDVPIASANTQSGAMRPTRSGDPSRDLNVT
ncbi:MAG: hypothetical protein IT182_13755 [Acidobacteria bacterium]|nr:hypothetical protein [Acidobacteriota bacterium]